jgi:hypothetical protein
MKGVDMQGFTREYPEHFKSSASAIPPPGPFWQCSKQISTADGDTGTMGSLTSATNAFVDFNVKKPPDQLAAIDKSQEAE